MDTEIRVSTESRPWRRKFSRRSSRDLNPRPFNHESGALTTELSLPPPIQQNAYLSWHRQHDAHFQGNPLLQATKRHWKNSETVKNNEKWYERWSNFSFCCCVQCLPEEQQWTMWTTFFQQTHTQKDVTSPLISFFIVFNHFTVV